MASPSPPPDSGVHADDDDFYYFILSIAGVAILLIISNVIAFACCDPCQLIQDLRSFLQYHGIFSGGHRRQNLHSIPVCKFQKDKEHEQASGGECPVCLSVFADGEEIRQLPQCTHSFHAPCIDMWLQSHSNCPVCRAKVTPQLPARTMVTIERSSSSSEEPRRPEETGDVVTVVVSTS